MLHELLVRELLPKFQSLLADKEPVPQYAIKIGRHVMEHNPAFGVIFQRLGLVSKFISFLDPSSPNCSSHNVYLVRALIQSSEDLESLYSCDIAQVC